MNRFTFTPMNYRVDRVLNSILTKAIDGGVKNVTSSSGGYYIDINFNDGSSMYAWNVNRYYAWLCEGCFTYPKENDKQYCWKDSRPSRSTMARLYKMLGKVCY